MKEGLAHNNMEIKEEKRVGTLRSQVHWLGAANKVAWVAHGCMIVT